MGSKSDLGNSESMLESVDFVSENNHLNQEPGEIEPLKNTSWNAKR